LLDALITPAIRKTAKLWVGGERGRVPAVLLLHRLAFGTTSRPTLQNDPEIINRIAHAHRCSRHRDTRRFC